VGIINNTKGKVWQGQLYFTGIPDTQYYHMTLPRVVWSSNINLYIKMHKDGTDDPTRPHTSHIIIISYYNLI